MSNASLNWIAIGAALLMPWLTLACVLLIPKKLALIPEGAGDSRVNVTVFALGPALVLAWGAMREPLPMEWIEPLALVIAGGAIMTIVAMKVSRASARRDRTFIVTGIAMFACFSVYAGASALILNRALDRGVPELYRTSVSHKHIERSADHQIRAYWMTFEMPWFAWARTKLAVDSNLYERVAIQEYACVRAHPGFLRIRWFDAQFCPVEAGLPGAAAPAPRVSPLLDQLAERSFAALDVHFNDLQRHYERREITDNDLYIAYREVMEASERYDELYERWVTDFPRSYAAHLLRGAHLFHVGQQVRGEEFFADVPAERVQRMVRYFDEATRDLKESLALSERPFLSALYLVNVAMYIGDESECRTWLKLGNKIEPQNLYVRRRYMNSLEPRWGGSYEAMVAFLEESRASGLPPDKLVILSAMIDNDRAYSLSDKKDFSGAAQMWTKEIDAFRAINQRPPFEAQQYYVTMLLMLNREEEAVPIMEELAVSYPDVVWIHATLATYYNKMKRYDQSWAHLQEGARLHDPWSEAAVGRTLYLGAPSLKIAPDKESGLGWLRRAASQGDHDATEFLRSH